MDQQIEDAGVCSNAGCGTVIAALQEELQLLRDATTTPLDEREQSCLAAEKSSRADLELYSSLLSQQRTALADQLIQQRSEAAHWKKLYEQDRHSLHELRATWQRANDQFLTSQRHSLALTQRLTSLLTSEQLKRLEKSNEDVLSSDTDEDDDPTGTTIIATSTPRQHQLYDEDSDENILEECQFPDKKASGRSVSSMGGSTSLDRACSSPFSTPTPPPATSDSAHLPRKHSADLLSIESDLSSSLALSSQFSPENLPRLTEEQQKALELVSGGISADDSPVHGSDALLASPSGGGGGVVVSKAAWRALNKNIKQTKAALSKPCQACLSHRTSSQEMRSELDALKAASVVKDNAIGRQLEELKKEATYRQNMEEKWMEQVEKYQQLESAWGQKLQHAARQHSTLIARWREVVEDLTQKMNAMTHDRMDAQAHLDRLHKDNSRLSGCHLQSARALQEETIDLPTTVEELHLLILRLKEDLITANVAKELAEENLASSVTQQLAASGENRELRDMVANLQQSATQEQQSEEQQQLSQKQLAAVTEQLQQLNKSKSTLEQEVLEQKQRVTGLQHDLDLSEETQRDFVRLSQSLQVQLEKIRQSDSEVRWQHEDDVDECNNCKQRFTSLRRKHHCRHCCRLFCSDCVAKTVPAGPNNRQCRVCDVCHTLLVPHATPYFSANK